MKISEQHHDQQPTHGAREGFLARAARPDQDNPNARRSDAVGNFDVLARGVPNFDGLAAVGRCGLPAEVPRAHL